MHSLSRVLVVALLVAGMTLPLHTAKAFTPFGGIVTLWSFCKGGIFIYVVNPDPVRGLPYSGTFVITPGSFLYGALPLLGWAVKGQSDAWIPCIPFGGQRVTFIASSPL